MQIIINERQLDIITNLLMEDKDGPLLNNGDVVEDGNPSQIGTSATITNSDGKPKPGKDVYSDEIGKFKANQDWRGELRLRTTTV